MASVVVQRLVGDHQHRLERRAQGRPAATERVSLVGLATRRLGLVSRLGLGASARRLTSGSRSLRSISSCWSLGRASDPAAGAPSNSSLISTSPSSAPVQRTCQLAERGDLVEGHHPLAEQLQQRQEPGDPGHRVRARRRPACGRSACRARRSRSTTRCACSRTLTSGAWMCAIETPSGSGLGSSALAARPANSSGPSPIRTSGSSWRTARRARRPAGTAGLGGHPGLQDAGDLLERPVLQQPREEQVAGLQQRQVLLVLDLAGRQQPGRLEVEQGGGDQQERRGLSRSQTVARRP